MTLCETEKIILNANNASINIDFDEFATISKGYLNDDDIAFYYHFVKKCYEDYKPSFATAGIELEEAAKMCEEATDKYLATSKFTVDFYLNFFSATYKQYKYEDCLSIFPSRIADVIDDLIENIHNIEATENLKVMAYALNKCFNFLFTKGYRKYVKKAIVLQVMIMKKFY